MRFWILFALLVGGLFEIETYRERGAVASPSNSGSVQVMDGGTSYPPKT